jgi:hypothetical protein
MASVIFVISSTFLCVMSLMSMSKVIALAIVICLGDGNVRDVSDAFISDNDDRDSVYSMMLLDDGDVLDAHHALADYDVHDSMMSVELLLTVVAVVP